MAKSYTDLYLADDTAGDNLTGNEIVAFDPDPNSGPTTSKAMTIEQFIVFISGQLLSQPGAVQFRNTSSSVTNGSSTEIEIIREDYLAYPSTGGNIDVAITNELTEGVDYTLEVNGVPFSNNGTITWRQYDISKVLKFTSISANTDSVTISLLNAASINIGNNNSYVLTVT